MLRLEVFELDWRLLAPSVLFNLSAMIPHGADARAGPRPQAQGLATRAPRRPEPCPARPRAPRSQARSSRAPAAGSRSTGASRRQGRPAAGGFGSPRPSSAAFSAPPRGPSSSQQARQRGYALLAHAALLSAACLAGTLFGGSGAGSSGLSTRSTAARAVPATSSIEGGSTAGSVRLAVVAPLQETSPFGVSWQDVLEHTGRRLAWQDADFQLALFDASAALAATPEEREALKASLSASQAVVALDVQDPLAAAALGPLLTGAPTVVSLGSADPLHGRTRLAGRAQPAPGQEGSPLAALLARLFPDKQAKLDGQVLHIVEDLYRRATSDDFLFIFLVLANSYIREVPAVSMTFKQKDAGLDSLQCMIGKCGGQILRCVTDTSCKAALDCLQICEFNDQVCSYRCITSYESQLLEDFSLCIIQKHNCFGLSAEIPMVPDPAPLPSWRGQPMTHELAEDLFIGWLGPDPSTGLQQLRGGEQHNFSWLVFAGKNAAYDFFPCQHQLFYRGKGKGGMWYDPVFQVKTIDGRTVWRRRHYRVKRDRKPGTFRFSVLDNGVTSNEFWRILDCDEGLQWCVFYYGGAASRAGLSYSGAILASRDGLWPESQEEKQRIEAALDRAGIRMWELSKVDNTACTGAPLDPSLLALA